MPTRSQIANFLQGLFVLPLCALFGGMVALLFHWQGGRLWGMVIVCAVFPMLGALKTRQSSLLAGLVAGAAVSVLGYFALRPHA